MPSKEKDVYCYVFEDQNSFYMYNYMVGFIIEITYEFYIEIKKWLNGEIVDLKYEEIIDQMLKDGIFSDGEAASAIEDCMEFDTAYLSFAPVYACNMRCDYCFGGHGDKYGGKIKYFTYDMLKKMLDYFFDFCYPQAEKYRIDFVSGGEPLLGFDIIKRAVSYIEDFSNRTNKNVSMWLCTNGLLLSDEICEYLHKHNILLGVSIDGKKEIHNRHRLDVNGRETYDEVIKNVQKYLGDKASYKKRKNVWGLSTATQDNLDFIDILQHLKSIGIAEAQIRLVRDSERYNVGKIVSNYRKLAEFLFNDFKKGNSEYLLMILNDNDQFGKVLKRILLDHIVVRRCEAGCNKLTICPDGTIYPCDSLVGIDFFKMGNINGQLSNKIMYEKLTVSNRSVCQGCEVKYLCGGDCYYNSYMKTGNFLSPDLEFCFIQKNIINMCIVLRYKMEMHSGEMYKKLLKKVKMKNEYSKIYG